MPYNFYTEVFTQTNVVGDFLQVKCNFRQKTAVLRFWAPLWGLGAMYTVHLGTLVVDFLLVITQLFLLVVTAESLQVNIVWKFAFSLQWGQFGPKFQVEGVAPPHQPLFLSENYDECHFMWCKNMGTISFILSQWTRLTDRKSSAIPCVALHAVAR